MGVRHYYKSKLQMNRGHLGVETVSQAGKMVAVRNNYSEMHTAKVCVLEFVI